MNFSFIYDTIVLSYDKGDFNMGLGENIKSIRTKKGITQLELARNLDVSVRTIQNYESGNREPNMNTLMKICSFLECSPMEIIDFTDFEKLSNSESNNNINKNLKLNEEDPKDIIAKKRLILSAMTTIAGEADCIDFLYNGQNSIDYESCEKLFYILVDTVKLLCSNTPNTNR